ncbi:MAG: hypothetical protein ACKOOG_14745 [Actinomycetota bacterium]
MAGTVARRSAIIIGLGLNVGIPLAIAGVGDSDTPASAPTPTTRAEDEPIGDDIGDAVIATARETTVEVPRGRVIVFDLGEAGDGRYLAASDDPAVVRIDNRGVRSRDGAALNAAGRALAAGTTTVTVQFAGPGTPRPAVQFEVTVTEPAS